MSSVHLQYVLGPVLCALAPFAKLGRNGTWPRFLTFAALIVVLPDDLVFAITGDGDAGGVSPRGVAGIRVGSTHALSSGLTEFAEIMHEKSTALRSVKQADSLSSTSQPTNGLRNYSRHDTKLVALTLSYVKLK